MGFLKKIITQRSALKLFLSLFGAAAFEKEVELLFINHARMDRMPSGEFRARPCDLITHLKLMLALTLLPIKVEIHFMNLCFV